MHVLSLDTTFSDRALNDGFSGGEKKKLEMLQLLVLNPKMVILDEIDSGLDIDAIKVVSQGLAHARQYNPDLTLLIITHYQRILDYIQPDHVHILHKGTLVRSGDYTLVHQLEKTGYDTIATER